jgi:hypothetical protein
MADENTEKPKRDEAHAKAVGEYLHSGKPLPCTINRLNEFLRQQAVQQQK